MAKRKVESQITNLTPDHKKSEIALMLLHESGMQHIIEKLSMKATILL
jgi:hypothetical protein